jgi:DNA-binding NarL/FixJ family response regulator
VRIVAALGEDMPQASARELLQADLRRDDEPLTVRELDVLRLAADGHEITEIARRLHRSERAVKRVTHSMFKRLGLRNRTHAVAYALRSGLI